MSEQTQSEVPALPRLTAVVDIFENDDHYLVRADVPGVDKDHVEISFHEGKLSFEATLESERVYTRTLGFGDDVDPDGIEASLEHGVLQLQLAKSAANKPRRIAIQA
jgi:HSP20 family protein